jgi:HEAT repeat protein
MTRKIKNIVWVIVGIMLLGTGIYAGTGQKMSFEEAQQKKESRKKTKASEPKQQAMSKEQWKSMPKKEKRKHIAQMMQAEAAVGADHELDYIRKQYLKGKLYPPADDTIIKLGGAKYKEAVPLFIEILKNYHVTDIRVSVAEALGNIGDSTAITVLLEALEYKDYQIKVAAAIALVKLDRSDDAFPVLAKVAQKKDIKNWDIDVESRLENYLDSEKEQKRKEYKESFANGSLPSKAVRYLGEIGSEPALDVIEKSLYDQNEFVRLRAGSILMKTNRKETAFPVLVAIVSDSSITRSVRSAALSAIAKGGGEKERAILEKYKNSNNKYLSKKAIKLIRKMGDK